jgi:hypothetical protein
MKITGRKKEIIELLDRLSPLFGVIFIFTFIWTSMDMISYDARAWLTIYDARAWLTIFSFLALVLIPCKHRIWIITSWGGIGTVLAMIIAFILMNYFKLTTDYLVLILYYILAFLRLENLLILFISIILSFPAYIFCRVARYRKGEKTTLIFRPRLNLVLLENQRPPDAVKKNKKLKNQSLKKVIINNIRNNLYPRSK